MHSPYLTYLDYPGIFNYTVCRQPARVRASMNHQKPQKPFFLPKKLVPDHPLPQPWLLCEAIAAVLQWQRCGMPGSRGLCHHTDLGTPTAPGRRPLLTLQNVHAVRTQTHNIIIDVISLLPRKEKGLGHKVSFQVASINCNWYHIYALEKCF